MKIWVHTIVRNEERYIWFSVMSVINYVDRILIWDTGSTDNTVQIIEQLKKQFPEKIDFREVGRVDPYEFTSIRQQMLDSSVCDWFIMVDGDEVWWDEGIREVYEIINKEGNNLETISNRYYNLVGDIFHFQEEKAGKYEIDGKIGHLTIRAINRKIPGLHFSNPHGTQAIYDEEKVPIQYRDEGKRYFINKKIYMHFTNMIRSKSIKEDILVMKRKLKMKYELGIQFPLDFYYPEVFFITRPSIVSTPWIKRSNKYFVKAVMQTPLRYIKRRYFSSKTSGY